MTIHAHVNDPTFARLVLTVSLILHATSQQTCNKRASTLVYAKIAGFFSVRNYV